MIDLKLLNEQYKTIIHSDISRDEKDKAYANLITYIEAHYNMSTLQEAEFESNNRAIIAIYQKLSMSISSKWILPTKRIYNVKEITILKSPISQH